MKIHSLAVLKARYPKSRCSMVGSFLAQRENLLTASLLASGGRQQSLAFLGLWNITPTSASILTWYSPYVQIPLFWI